MASSGSREQFLRQMEQIVEGIKQSRIKVQNQSAVSYNRWNIISFLHEFV